MVELKNTTVCEGDKPPMPVLSFFCVSLLGITARELNLTADFRPKEWKQQSKNMYDNNCQFYGTACWVKGTCSAPCGNFQISSFRKYFPALANKGGEVSLWLQCFQKNFQCTDLDAVKILESSNKVPKSVFVQSSFGECLGIFKAQKRGADFGLLLTDVFNYLLIIISEIMSTFWKSSTWSSVRLIRGTTLPIIC